jgi:hypothetical protein
MRFVIGAVVWVTRSITVIALLASVVSAEAQTLVGFATLPADTFAPTIHSVRAV